MKELNIKATKKVLTAEDVIKARIDLEFLDKIQNMGTDNSKTISLWKTFGKKSKKIPKKS